MSACVGHRDHPALAGRELLVGVEAKDRRVPAPADRNAVGVHRTERLAGILDDRQAMPGGDPLEGDHVGGKPKMCTGSSALVRSLSAASAASGSRLSVTRVDVGEHRPGALIERHVG